ncbi:MAG: DUF2892 domain-containing protein [Betaproteobacteria bacterium]|nr:MAG: DUF2892 domain-containing protein [Betaproteobacteria bacterium]
MTSNMGNADRVIRFILGIALLSLFFMVEGGARWLGLIGVVLIVTSSARFCPLYKLLGLNTTGAKTSSDSTASSQTKASQYQKR